MTTPLTKPAPTADEIGLQLERTQNQRLAIGSAISLTVNILFLVGAANAMKEQPLALAPEPPPIFVTFDSPAPPATPAPVPTPAPKQVAKQEPKHERQKPREHRVPPVQHRKPVRVAVNHPRPVHHETPPPPPEDIATPTPEVTPPPIKPTEAEQPIAKTNPESATVTPDRGTPNEMKAANRNTSSDLAVSAMNAAPKARGGSATGETNLTGPATPNSGPGGGPSLSLSKSSGGPRVAEGEASGAASATGGDFPTASNSRNAGAPSVRAGAANGSNAPGVAGIVGSARGATGSVVGSAGAIAGPSLNSSSGPSLGGFGGSAGKRNSILTQMESGASSSKDFTVASGSGLKPGAVVSRQGSAAGGSAGITSNAMLAPRVAGGGQGGGGAELAGATFRPSMGGAGGGSGPVGLRKGNGPGAGAGDGALGGGAAGDPGGVAVGGVAGSNGGGSARVSGAGGHGGVGEGAKLGAKGGSSNGEPGVANGRPGNGGPGSGPGGSGDGPSGSGKGIGTGNAGGDPGALGVKGGAADGVNGGSLKGTNAAGAVGRDNIEVKARGGGGADIQTTKIGTKEGTEGGAPVTVASKGKEDRATPGLDKGPSTLGTKVNAIEGADAFEDAKATSKPKPAITDEMKASGDLKSVRVQFTIAPNGSSTFKILSSSGNDAVDAAVSRACAGYRWKAATRGGKPVSAQQIITFDPKD